MGNGALKRNRAYTNFREERFSYSSISRAKVRWKEIGRNQVACGRKAVIYWKIGQQNYLITLSLMQITKRYNKILKGRI